jgi:hypothetical protein
MSQEMTSAYQSSIRQDRKGIVLFFTGAVVMVAMMFLGYSIEDELTTYGMKVLEERQDPVMGLVFLFAFGFPLGVVATMAGALAMGKTPVVRVAVIALSGVGLVSLAALVPAVFGRELSGAYFGTGGITILIAMVVSFWYWAQYRTGLHATARNATDIKALGYLCFGLAAWNTCGLASLPSFGLDPETMLAQGMRPFAIGQAKSVMAYFVLGWFFTAVGFYKSVKPDQE